MTPEIWVSASAERCVTFARPERAIGILGIWNEAIYTDEPQSGIREEIHHPDSHYLRTSELRYTHRNMEMANSRIREKLREREGERERVDILAH